MKHRIKKEEIIGFIFISPWVIGFFAFTLIPMLISGYLSFTEWNVLTGLEGINFVGFENYSEIFTDDEDFWQSLKVTFTFSFIFLPLSQVFALALACLLNQKVKGLKIFRTILFMPTVMPAVAVSLLWMWIFNSQYGILNRFLAIFSIQGPDWLQNPKTSLSALIIMGLWGVGSTMIIFLSALQDVPSSLYEAASIDGITPFKRFLYITVPMISSTIFFNLVMGIIGSFQYFTQAHVMTKGGPLGSTLFYNLYLYNVAFEKYEMGYASALAWIMFFIIVFFTALVFKSSTLWVYYENEGKSKGKKMKGEQV
ncbi:ABC transporter permease [Candidatus Epulonipiscium fishelsonii]|uniref:ABC transporter permease n=1 Tax=Candidatus Epulonipiscium fishelsonii TaxID=77094 RepID=A0ACC8XBW1_9FIRM|nr:ABC transporter permease [Epulopiscium sp. SCG-B05WGA-EpuloA1]ONI40001.1 ABC transporter permease [Epulopiscium sp. SCG-B11WGA-EpuloA1]